MAKKEEKNVKKEKQQAKKKKIKKESFVVGLKQELAKVKWPTKKEVLKYTIATLAFIIFLVIFFVLLTLLMSVIQEVF